MSGTSNLNAPYIQAGQNQKEVTANAAFDRLDRAMTETLALISHQGTPGVGIRPAMGVLRVVEFV